MSKSQKVNNSQFAGKLKGWFGRYWMAVTLFVLPFYLSAQPKDNAPYSRIGLGEPVGQTMSAAGFAGLSAAYNDPLHINLLNPAALGSLASTTFETGLFLEYSSLKFNNQSTKVWSGNLNHIALAFPLFNQLNDAVEKRKRDFLWTMNIAILPNTRVGYDIQTEEVHPQIDTTLNIFQGTGGTNKLVWGNGFQYKNLSFGLNLMYLFGQLESERNVIFRNLEASYSDKYVDNITIRGLLWNLGIQYRHNFDKAIGNEAPAPNRSLTVGLYGNSKNDFTTRSTALRIRENLNYIPVQSDTLLAVQDMEGKGKLPSEWTFGLMYQKTGKFRAGMDYSIAKWSKYENEAKPETLFDSRRIAVGAEYLPDALSYNNYLMRVRYRAGFYHQTDARLDDLNQYALTFGFGLPVILPRQQTSFVNLSFEIGKYSTSNAINETFVKMALGFTLNDNTWFFKRKFG